MCGSVKKTACFFLYDVHCTLIIHIVYISTLCKICVFKDMLKMKFSSPIVSGNCCSMLEESRRSSRDSHPDMSASRLSILFLARSRQRSCLSFPIDYSERPRELTESHTLFNGYITFHENCVGFMGPLKIDLNYFIYIYFLVHNNSGGY